MSFGLLFILSVGQPIQLQPPKIKLVLCWLDQLVVSWSKLVVGYQLFKKNYMYALTRWKKSGRCLDTIVYFFYFLLLVLLLGHQDDSTAPHYALEYRLHLSHYLSCSGKCGKVRDLWCGTKKMKGYWQEWQKARYCWLFLEVSGNSPFELPHQTHDSSAQSSNPTWPFSGALGEMKPSLDPFIWT